MNENQEHRRQPISPIRSAFTLTELMVSIVIIAILSSVALYGMASVQKQAQIQRTKTQIKRIHELIAVQWESFEDRSIRITTSYTRNQRKSRARLYALREQMKLELPDRVSDVLGSTANGVTFQPNNSNFGYEPFVPPSSFRYFQARAPDSWTFQHQGAECLYMILSRIQVGDMSALESFSEKEFGDTDGDGMPEILDAWGRPLNFIRWAPGFTGPSVYQTGNSVGGNDAFDYMDVDPRRTDASPANDTFAIFPLIFSSGPDGIANIRRDFEATELPGKGDTVIYSQTGNPAYSSTYNPSSGLQVPNDPYVFLKNSQVTQPTRLGAVIDTSSQGHQDNIYSHFIETSAN